MWSSLMQISLTPGAKEKDLLRAHMQPQKVSIFASVSRVATALSDRPDDFTKPLPGKGDLLP